MFSVSTSIILGTVPKRMQREEDRNRDCSLFRDGFDVCRKFNSVLWGHSGDIWLTLFSIKPTYWTCSCLNIEIWCFQNCCRSHSWWLSSGKSIRYLGMFQSTSAGCSTLCGVLDRRTEGKSSNLKTRGLWRGRQCLEGERRMERWESQKGNVQRLSFWSGLNNQLWLQKMKYHQGVYFFSLGWKWTSKVLVRNRQTTTLQITNFCSNPFFGSSGTKQRTQRRSTYMG